MILVADISNNNAHVNVGHLLAAGVGALYHKATEGHDFVDQFFASHRAQALNLQLPFGAYHFAHTDDDPHTEAARFCRIVGSLGHRELRPALDLETGDPRKGEAWARVFNQEVKRHLGTLPIFYSYPDFVSRMRIEHGPIGDGLWIASYGRDDGHDYPFMVPKPWTHATLHQFTSVGKLAGVPIKVDLSHTHTLEGLWAHPILARL